MIERTHGRGGTGAAPAGGAFRRNPLLGLFLTNVVVLSGLLGALQPAPVAAVSTTVVISEFRVRDIQGSSHTSPRDRMAVSNVPGVVTALRSNGFYLQDTTPDADDATSEGIFVFTSGAPKNSTGAAVVVGDALQVSGNVSEFIPGGTSTANLSTTQISASASGVVKTGTLALPTPVVIGADGRVPPTTVIEDDAFGSFDPATDGIDFYESLEGMLVQVNNSVVVGPTNNFGEIVVLADNGVGTGLRTPRGGIVIGQGYSDFNPERIIIDDAIVGAEPQVNVGDRFNAPIVGVLDYNFGNFKLLNTAALPATTSGGLTKEVTAVMAAADRLTVGTFNVENLDPGDGTPKFDALARVIVANLRSPDILALEEVQDNNGPTNDATVDATTTYNTLIDAIERAGGPRYEFRQINPVDDQDGGQPGGNIRVGFLFNPARVQFVDRPGGGPTVPTTVVNESTGPRLSVSPGRIDPDNFAFADSRKPLAGEFVFGGRTFFVIANHFNSKGGDQALFGRFQPPARSSEAQRRTQAQIVNDFVDQLLAADPRANVVVAGDLNDFQFSDMLTILKGEASPVLFNLIDTLPYEEQYTYIFEGNSQVLDHILVSNNLRNNAPFDYDVVHVNAEFADQISDHDPQVARFAIVAPAAQNRSATTTEDTPVEIVLGPTNENGAPLTYAIVSGPTNGAVAVSGNRAIYTPRANYTGPDSFTFRAGDGSRQSNVATVSITVGAVNDVPAAQNDGYTTNEDTALDVAAPGVLANDSDPEGAALTAVLAVAPTNGTLTLNPDGSFRYTPGANFAGTDGFQYRAQDAGGADSNVATVTITVSTVGAPPPTYALALNSTAGGSATALPAPNAPNGRYTPGTVVTLTATPAGPGFAFIGFTVNGIDAGLANPLTLTMNSDKTVVANFAVRQAFSDVTPSNAAYEAIGQLAGRGVIRGLDAETCRRLGRATPCFGPDQTTVRAQMAALIARGIGRDAEEWGNRFTDTGGVDVNLRRNINTLAHYDIARGFPEPVCRSQGVGIPCFLPFERVLGAQTISLITRAMVTEGRWEYRPDNRALYPNVPADSGHRIDLATFVHYVGVVPDTNPTAPWVGWNQPASRGFFARTLVQALSYDAVP